MRYAIFCYHSEATVGSWSREQEQLVLARREAVRKRLAAEGKLGPVVRLMPTTAATTVRGATEPLVLDGPFAETKEQLLGFYMVDCATLEEAIEVGRALVGESGAMEIRPIRSYLPDGVAT